MINSPHDKEFVFQNGERAKNLVELVHRLEHINNHDFNHFVNHSKNDFANWIEHVLKDHLVSQKLRLTHSKDNTIQILKDRILEINEDSHKATFGGSIIHPHKKSEEIKHLDSKHENTKHSEHSITHNKESEIKHTIEEKIEHKLENHPKIVEKYSEEKYIEKIEPKHEKKSEKPPVTRQLNDFNRDHARRDAAIKEKKKWFKLFRKKHSDHLPEIETAKEIMKETSIKVESESKKEQKLESKSESKSELKNEIVNEIASDERENTLWVVLYFALISLIAILLIYRWFFR